METLLSSSIFQAILAFATLLGGMSAYRHLFYSKKQNNSIHYSMNIYNKTNPPHTIEKEYGKEHIVNVHTGVIDAYGNSLIIDGDIICYDNIIYFGSDYIIKEEDYGGPITYLLDTAIGKANEEPIIKSILKLAPFLYVFLVSLIVSDITDIELYISDGIKFIASLLYILTIGVPAIIFASLYVVAIAIRLVYFFYLYKHPDKYKIYFIKICLKDGKIYKLWVYNDKKDYSLYNEVYSKLKNRILKETNKENLDNKKLRIELGYHGTVYIA